MKLINFIYFDEMLVNNLHSQLSPQVDSIKESAGKSSGGSTERRFGFNNLINIFVGSATNKSEDMIIEKSITPTSDQRALDIINYLLGKIKHFNGEGIPSLISYINQGTIVDSEILVCYEDFTLQKIFENNAVVYERSSDPFEHFRSLDDILYLHKGFLKEIANDHGLSEGHVSSSGESWPISGDSCPKKLINNVSFLLDRTEPKSHEGRAAEEFTTYKATMRMDGSKMRLHIRHLTYFFSQLSFRLKLVAEITNAGNNEYIIKPILVWR
jgi:hypothetical protein